MEIIFEKNSFQPTRSELSKSNTFRNIFKKKEKKTRRANPALTSLTIFELFSNYKDTAQLRIMINVL